MIVYVVVPIIVVIFLVLFMLKLKSIRANVAQSVDHEMTILEIIIPKAEEGSILNASSISAEHLFASLHGLLKEDYSLQEHFSFEIVSDASGIKFYVVAPHHIIKFVESQIYAQYPTAQMVVSQDYINEKILGSSSFEMSTLDLIKENYIPIKTFRDFEVDPLSGLMSALGDIHPGELMAIQMVMRPLPDGWQQDGHDYVKEVTTGKAKKSSGVGDIFAGIIRELLEIFAEIPGALLRGNTEEKYRSGGAPREERIVLNSFQQLEVDIIENKLGRMGYETLIRVLAIADDRERIDRNLRSVGASLKQYSTNNSNELISISRGNSTDLLDNYIKRSFDSNYSIILSNEELATIFHLPSSRADAPNVSWVHSKTGEPPSNLPTTDCNYIGETVYRGKKVRFGLKEGDDRLRHMYLIGKTGSGKSTLLNIMITQDIMNGHGVGVLDPHGETIENVLDRIPDHRIDDVIIVDPSDSEYPVGLNLLELNDPTQKNLMASALLAAIKQHFEYSWGPRLEYLLNYTFLTLMDVPGTSMLGITRLLEDKNYRNYILHQVTDPVVTRFWENEYKEMSGNQRLVTEAVAPIQNKVNRFLASTTIRNILGQRKSTVDIWDAMQSQKILLINLSKGKIGADNANLLGALLVSRIQSMALQRAKIRPEERKPFYLYVDEFQNFASGSFEEILSESRKYKLGLHLTHQFTAQLPDELLKAVFGNVGTIATFSLGAPDARVLANEFAPYFDQEDIISLGKFNIYIKMMLDGMTTLPFSAKILLPWMPETSIVPETNNRERAIQRSRQKYGTNREYVEDVIARWVQRPFDKGMAIAEEQRAKRDR